MLTHLSTTHLVILIVIVAVSAAAIAVLIHSLVRCSDRDAIKHNRKGSPS